MGIPKEIFITKQPHTLPQKMPQTMTKLQNSVFCVVLEDGKTSWAASEKSVNMLEYENRKWLRRSSQKCAEKEDEMGMSKFV